MPPAILRKNGVRISLPHVPASGLGDGDRRQDRAQPGEGCRGPLQWPRAQGLRHVCDHPGEGLERGPHVLGSKGGFLDKQDEFKTQRNEQEQRKLIATFLKNLISIVFSISAMSFFCLFSSRYDECNLSSWNIQYS